MLRAVVDPGVLVSALVAPSGPPGRLLGALLDGRWQLIASPWLLEELRTVLLRRKFHRYYDAVAVSRLLDRLIAPAELVDDPEERPVVTRDPADDYLVALARAAAADVLVSGDNDVLDAAVHDVTVLSPREFLQRLDPD